MGLFDFLKKSDQINNTGVVGLPNVEDVSKEILPEIKREDFVDDSEPILESNAMTIKYGTGMPIDAIYAYIQDDYEQEGYSDAMCNADMAYKESKKEIIKNGLKMLFEQVRLRYESDIRDINVQIDIVDIQGLTTSSMSLKARRDTYNEHLKKINDMELSLDREDKKMMNMIASYERGFLKGVDAKSESFINR